ncbi:MAG: glycosyltransferase family 39 protein [Elusimicrobiales bacterium]|nr:glycosyltransferase family 39 protein [Elusimicrobiales bacterium]
MIKNYINDKKYLYNVFIILIFSISLKLFLLHKSGPIYYGDSAEYLEVINNINNGFGFSRIDISDNIMKPYSNKPPLFFYIVYFSKFLFGSDWAQNITIINIISSSLTIILWIYISLIITQKPKISLITGWMMALNLNILYKSFLIMSDTYYIMIFSLFLLLFLTALRSKKAYLFFASGILMGISVLTRTLLKAYWILILPLIILYFKDEIKQKIKYALLFLLGHSIIVVPYHIRNYLEFNSLTPIEFHQGITLCQPIINLFKNTNYDHLYTKYPKIKEIINIPPYKGIAPDEYKIKTKVKLTDAEMAKYLTIITLYTIKQNPISFIKIYIRNFINLITSPSSYLSTIDIFYKDYFEKQHEIIKKFINDYKTVSFKEFLIITPNLFFRFINLILFLTFLAGITISFKQKYINKEINIFIISLIAYIIGVTSLTPSYDRYRLPLEPIICFYLSLFIFYIMSKNKFGYND